MAQGLIMFEKTPWISQEVRLADFLKNFMHDIKNWTPPQEWVTQAELDMEGKD